MAKVSTLFKEFLTSEKASGFLLVVCTVVSLLLANSALQQSYIQFWHTPLWGSTLEYWINDGLMAIFFLLIGLELEREIYFGELSSIKNATLPIVAAIGGMLVPAGIYIFFNRHTSTASGAGIPMATDIAFALGILALVGKRVPTSLKVFLTALAVIDDLGAILVIAIFYTKTLALTNLFIAIGIFIILLIANKLKIKNIFPYLIGGIAMWYFMLHSGVHATITGVLLAFALPSGNGTEKSASYILQKKLHKPVAFFILPIFALANTALVLHFSFADSVHQSHSMGIVLGLLIGKPLGIFLFSVIAVYLGICALPIDLNFRKLFGAALLGGIGFTMSIFIALLAFSDNAIIDSAKIMILLASTIAGILGFIWLKIFIIQRNE